MYKRKKGIARVRWYGRELGKLLKQDVRNVRGKYRRAKRAVKSIL